MNINPSRVSRCVYWRKAIVFTKAVLGGARWRSLALKLAQDPEITPELMEQALAGLCVYKRLEAVSLYELAIQKLTDLPEINACFSRTLTAIINDTKREQERVKKPPSLSGDNEYYRRF